MYRQLVAHAKKHPHYNAVIHALIGLGIGILLARPVFTVHPMRWGILFLALGLLGHLYPLATKK